MLACFISLRKRTNLRISRLNSKKKAAKLNLQLFLNLLSRQGSNLDSSDPESDVLPITLRDNFRVQK